MLAALLSEKEAMLDNALVAIAMVRERIIISCNRRFEIMFGYQPSDALGQSTQIPFIPRNSLLIRLAKAYSALINDEPFTRIQLLARTDGSAVRCEMTGKCA